MKEEIKRLKALKRRSFFSTLGKSVAGLLLLNALPLKALYKKDPVIKEQNKKTKVMIHPLAVKRNKKGYNG